MQFKTREGVSLQGLPKVYYTAHPEDFSLYLDTLSELILKYQNCAVFFDSNPEQPEDFDSSLFEDKKDFYPVLNDIQLIVIPITYKFLESQKCFARSQVFAYAMKQYIPVLPILEETGIETRFNQVCGDMHFLNAQENDPTAIPFEEKLSKYLNFVLIGNELAEKVRNVFEAYFFISYRKKDREEAQKLMRLIHENDFCRDIALWYDEYLVPGENFNQAIQKAMRKSDLFVLNVTPSLLEKPNYVMDHEFPGARDAGMHILPVEMKQTNQNQLQADYAEIPPCIQPSNLSTYLLRFFSNAGKNQTPEHIFLIGLAYLDGVDMEVNREKAAELITSAANQNLPEAMKKLAHMYGYGEGLAKDIAQSVAWHRKLSSLCKQQYQQKQTEETAWDWLDALDDFGKNLEILMQPNDAASAYLDMLKATQTVNKQFNHANTWKYLAESYCALARITNQSGTPQVAKQYLKEAARVFRQIDDTSGTHSSQTNLITVYTQLAALCDEEKNPDEIIQYYSVCADFYEKMASKSQEEQLQQAVVYLKLGRCFQNHSANSADWKTAGMYFKQSLQICLPLSAVMHTPELKVTQCRAYYGLGKNIAQANDAVTAKIYYHKAIEIIEPLAVTGLTEYQQTAAELFYDMGLADAEQEAHWMKKSRAMWQEIFKRFGTQRPEVWRNFRLTALRCDIIEIKARAKNGNQPQDYEALAAAYWNISRLEPLQEVKWVQFAYSLWSQLAQIYPTIPELTSRTEMAAQRLEELMSK